MNEELDKLLQKYFPKGEYARIKTLIENQGQMKRDSGDSNYKLTMRAINKLKCAKALLGFKQIQMILKRPNTRQTKN